MNKENECEIVQDLLLNYEDGVLHKSTEEFVKKHIETCENCQKRLKEIKQDIEDMQEQEEQEKEIDYLKKINKKINVKKILIIIISTMLAIIIILNVAVFINYNNMKEQLGNFKIFLSDDITNEELKNIEKVIKTIDDKAEIQYVSKEEVLDETKEKFSSKENLIEQYEQNNPFRAYYIVKTDYIEKLQEELKDVKGVSNTSSLIHLNPYELFIGTIAKKLTSK